MGKICQRLDVYFAFHSLTGYWLKQDELWQCLDESLLQCELASLFFFYSQVKGDSVFHNNRLNVSIDNEILSFEKTAVYYVDEIPPEFSMKSLTPGLIAVIVVVIIAIVAAIVVLVSSNKAVEQNG